MTDQLVRNAQDVFLPGLGTDAGGNDGYVSFELDPLLEDPQLGPAACRARSPVHRAGQEMVRRPQNRMIKVPATPAGLDALGGAGARPASRST